MERQCIEDVVTQTILTINLAATNTMMSLQHAFATGVVTEINHSVSLEGINFIPIMVDIKRVKGKFTACYSILKRDIFPKKI